MTAELEAIRDEARALEPAPAPTTADGGAAGPGAAPAAEVITAAELEAREAQEWASLPYLFGSIVGRALPELRAVYTEAACLEWGRAMVPIAHKYGWTVSGFSPWLGLAGATWKLADPTIDAVRAARARAEAQARARSGTGTDQPPVTGTGTDGARPAPAGAG